MAAKLTFEAKMQGMEQVLEMLKQAESRMNDLGRVGAYSMDGVSNRFKELQTSLETIGKSQTGIGGIFKSFDDLNKKSNEFLGKSYKSIIDAARHEVRQFEGEVDKIKNKVTEAERDLERLRSRRSTMSEQDFQREESSHVRSVAAAHAQQVAAVQQRDEMQREIFQRQQIPGVGGALNAMGLGQYNTMGSLMRGIPTAMMAPEYIAKTMEGVGNLGLQYGYTREVDAYLAQARLRRAAATQAMSGDPTTFLLQDLGAGVEKQAMDSAWTKTKMAGSYLSDNPFVRMLAGAGAGGRVGFAVGTMVPGIGNVLGAVLGAVGGGIYGLTSAGNRSYSQIEAEQRSELRGKDSELYGILTKAAGENFMRESRDLDASQRMYGIESVHNAVMGSARLGQSMDRANPVISMLSAQGLDANNYMANGDIGSYITGNTRFGFGQGAQQAMIRSTALNGGTLSDQQMNMLDVYAGAGLTGRNTIGARSTFGEYAAGLASQRGAGQDITTVGQGVAAAIGTNSTSFNPVEGVQQGIANFEQQGKMIQQGGSAMDMILVSKLRTLGVTNAVTIDAFIKMDVRNPKTVDAIAKYTGKSPDEVRAALGEVAKTYSSMFGAVIGKGEAERFNKATGGDLATLLTTGVKAFDNTTAGGGKFMDSLQASLGGKGRGDGGKVEVGFETMADKENAARATQQVTVDDQLKKALGDTGKTVTDAITAAVVKGFLDVADEVKRAGDRIVSDQHAATATPFNGPKDMDGRKRPGEM
jgi:hypothetical protein